MFQLSDAKSEGVKFAYKAFAGAHLSIRLNSSVDTPGKELYRPVVEQCILASSFLLSCKKKDSYKKNMLTPQANNQLCSH